MTGDDPGPRPGTRLPRLYPDPDPSEPAGDRPPAKQSTTWEVRQADGTETVTHVAGSPLAVPQLGALLHLLFAGPPGVPVPHYPPGRVLLRITWRADDSPAGTAELHEDGRLITDDGSGGGLEAWLSAAEVDGIRAALRAADLLRDTPTGG